MLCLYRMLRGLCRVVLVLICIWPMEAVAGCVAMQNVRAKRMARVGSPTKTRQLRDRSNKGLHAMLAQMFFPGDVLRQGCQRASLTNPYQGSASDWLEQPAMQLDGSDTKAGAWSQVSLSRPKKRLTCQLRVKRCAFRLS